MTTEPPVVQPDDMGPSRVATGWRRTAFFAAGCVFVPVGIAGVFLPVLPGTPFLILAAACFARSSPRFEAWLLHHPRLGPPVRRWRENGAIPRRAKWIAYASLALSAVLIVNTDMPNAVKVVSLVIFMAVAGYMVTAPEA